MNLGDCCVNHFRCCTLHYILHTGRGITFWHTNAHSRHCTHTCIVYSYKSIQEISDHRYVRMYILLQCIHLMHTLYCSIDNAVLVHIVQWCSMPILSQYSTVLHGICIGGLK